MTDCIHIWKVGECLAIHDHNMAKIMFNFQNREMELPLKAVPSCLSIGSVPPTSHGQKKTAIIHDWQKTTLRHRRSQNVTSS